MYNNMPCPRIPVLHPVKRFRENDSGNLGNVLARSKGSLLSIEVTGA